MPSMGNDTNGNITSRFVLGAPGHNILWEDSNGSCPGGNNYLRQRVTLFIGSEDS